jgi:hypothetical protein
VCKEQKQNKKLIDQCHCFGDPSLHVEELRSVASAGSRHGKAVDHYNACQLAGAHSMTGCADLNMEGG